MCRAQCEVEPSRVGAEVVRAVFGGIDSCFVSAYGLFGSDRDKEKVLPIDGGNVNDIARVEIESACYACSDVDLAVWEEGDVGAAGCWE